uniref:Uncharacterized protein n=1 Tax=Panagrellus redivivus TaxID=6233 RepID=A0A7E5A1S7_PANRE
MDSFRTATSPTTTKLDFNAMFDKICNLTSLASPMTVMQPPAPPQVHVTSPASSRRSRNVSPRILKRGESQPSAMVGPPPTANQRRLRFQQFSQVGGFWRFQTVQGTTV